jgi:hypothetical protein
MKKVYIDILIMIVGFVAIGWLTGSYVFYYIGGVIALLATIPLLAKLMVRYWRLLGKAIGFVTSRVWLTLFYFLFITPFAFFYRLIRKKNSFSAGTWLDAEEEVDFTQPW